MMLNRPANAAYLKALARGFGGALLFSIPLLMTMEMWQLGFYMDRGRLLIFLLALLPVLLGLSYFAGFEPTFRLRDEFLDVLAALGIGILTSSIVLTLLGVLSHEHALGEIAGKIGLAAAPGAIGALLAGKQLGARDVGDARPKADGGYLGELFTMLVGALFLALNIAPTEDVMAMAFQMTPIHALALLAVSIMLLHVFVYELGFPGEDLRRGDSEFARTFLTFTAPGYGIALLVSLYSLWTFGRLDGVSSYQAAVMMVVLGFPAALGCATARLVI